jgi:anti-sigma-K factor RskA
VAALQSDARDPGFILTVDAASRRYTVRRVGPPPAAGKSYELWIVPSKFGEPHSIGVIDGEFTVSGGLAGYDAAAVNNSIYAVTVEAKGGSPSGKPTAQPLWAGKLYESVPAH